MEYIPEADSEAARTQWLSSRTSRRAGFLKGRNSLCGKISKFTMRKQKTRVIMRGKIDVLDILTLTHHLVALAPPDSVGFCLKRGFASCAARAGAEGPMSA